VLLLLLLLLVVIVVVLLIPGMLIVILHLCTSDSHWLSYPRCIHRTEGLLLSLHLVITALPPSLWPFSSTFSTTHGHWRRAAFVNVRNEGGTVGGREVGSVGRRDIKNIVHHIARSSR
jgi:hypothetical protein